MSCDRKTLPAVPTPDVATFIGDAREPEGEHADWSITFERIEAFPVLESELSVIEAYFSKELNILFGRSTPSVNDARCAASRDLRNCGNSK